MSDQPPENPYAAPEPEPTPPPAAPAPPPAPAPYAQPPAAPSPYGQPTYGQPTYPAQQPYGQPTYPAQPYGQPAYPVAMTSGRDPDKRPGTVTTACILTFVFAGLAALASLVMFAVIKSGNQDFIDAFEESAGSSDLGMTPAELLDIIGIVFLVFAVWSLISIGLAVWAIKRSNVARILLVVSASLAALVSLISIASILPGLWLLASLATAILLFVGGANDWYARRVPKDFTAPPQPW